MTTPAFRIAGRRRHGELAEHVVAQMINATNRLAVIVHQKGNSYEPGMFDGMTS